MRADRQLVGLACVLGVLAHGGGQFFHRRGGFFQIGRLLLGTARQIIVAGGDLCSRSVDVAGGVLDVGDDGRQLRGGGVGIAGDTREHALEIAMHARAEAAIGNRAQHAGDLAEVQFGGLHQSVQAVDHRAEVMLEARAVATLAEVTPGGGFGQAADLAIDRAQIGLGGIQCVGDHGLLARQPLHVLAEVADGVAPHDRDRAHLYLDVRIDQRVAVGHHRAERAGEGTGIHAVADGAGFMRLCHRGLCIEHTAQRGLHRLHGLREATDLIAAAHLHNMLQITGGHCTRSGFHRQHRLHHRTPQPPAQAHQQQHGGQHGQRRAQQQRLPRLLRTGRYRRFGHLRGVRTQRIQRGCHRAVLAAHEVVAGGGIVAGLGERLQRRVIVLLQLRMQADEGLRQFARACIRAADQALGQLLDQTTLAVEGVQVALAQRVVVAAQQHVLPFLHLAAELALQAFGIAAVRDFGWNLGGQLQPGGGQAGQSTQQDHRQTNGNRAEQLGLQARSTDRRIHGEGLSGRGTAVSTRCAHPEVRCASHSRFV
ncbi:hypothetical protein PGKDCPLP_00865 [Stenotrophomonas maltophilia]|nr:hypothetical protein PGKDCPLP_00865 [Stenotrophomonas maltophilia]